MVNVQGSQALWSVQSGVNVRPKGGSRGPSSRDGCGAQGNDADGFTPPEMFVACAAATSPTEGLFIHSRHAL